MAIEDTDNYLGLPAGAGEIQELVDTAVSSMKAAYAKNVLDDTRFQDNITELFREVADQQLEA